MEAGTHAYAGTCRTPAEPNSRRGDFLVAVVVPAPSDDGAEDDRHPPAVIVAPDQRDGESTRCRIRVRRLVRHVHGERWTRARVRIRAHAVVVIRVGCVRAVPELPEEREVVAPGVVCGCIEDERRAARPALLVVVIVLVIMLFVVVIAAAAPTAALLVIVPLLVAAVALVILVLVPASAFVIVVLASFVPLVVVAVVVAGPASVVLVLVLAIPVPLLVTATVAPRGPGGDPEVRHGRAHVRHLDRG